MNVTINEHKSKNVSTIYHSLMKYIKHFKLVHGELMKNRLMFNQMKSASKRSHSIDHDEDNHQFSSIKGKFEFH